MKRCKDCRHENLGICALQEVETCDYYHRKESLETSMKRQCKNCEWLRHDIREFGGTELPKKYGKYTNPCNRFPRNIMRSPEEPTCGEFKEKK